jgi:hypothetical protein
MGRWGCLVGMIWVSAAGAQPPCPHPYFPMQEGLELTYRAGSAQVVVTFSDVVGDGRAQSATLHMQHGERAGQTQASCTPEGVVTSGGLEGAALSMSGMEVNILSTEGVAMPPPAAMTPGATWSNTLKIELRPPPSMKMPVGAVRSTFTKDSVVEGRERIEVAGRSWDALRIRNTVTAMAGTSGQRSLQSTLWLAPGVGILRIQTGESVDLELEQIKRPAKKAARTVAPALPGAAAPGASK